VARGYYDGERADGDPVPDGAAPKMKSIAAVSAGPTPVETFSVSEKNPKNAPIVSGGESATRMTLSVKSGSLPNTTKTVENRSRFLTCVPSIPNTTRPQRVMLAVFAASLI
jgi:hypothetical protein